MSVADIGPMSESVSNRYRADVDADIGPIYEAISGRYRSDMKCLLGYNDCPEIKGDYILL